MLLEIRSIFVGILLGIQGYFDIKNKEIPLWITVAGGMAGLLISVCRERLLVDIFWALLPGVVFLILGKITREAVGYGDGMLVGVLGLFYSLEEIFSLCFIAFLFTGTTALILLVILHKKGSYQIPFIPFLFLGWCIQVLT